MVTPVLYVADVLLQSLGQATCFFYDSFTSLVKRAMVKLYSAE